MNAEHPYVFPSVEIIEIEAEAVFAGSENSAGGSAPDVPLG